MVAAMSAGDGHRPPPLAIKGMTVAYGDKPAVFSVDANFPAGALSAIIGPNGAGKSTLLKAALGIVPVLSGVVRFYGEPLGKSRDRVAYVPQRAAVDWEFPARVVDVVGMGLYRKLGLLRPFGRRQRAETAAALARVGMAEFGERQIGQLSGGQQQRVFLARALAQDADLYVLDEPFAGVDAVTEAAIIGVLKGLRDAGKAVICVHHDLSTVTSYFDHVLLLNIRKVAEGPTASAFTEENLRAAYGGRLVAPSPGPGA
jgi:manganese/zinc/iron transport system ATP- binding protein